jgi:Tol biopolymer transport system component
MSRWISAWHSEVGRRHFMAFLILPAIAWGQDLQIAGKIAFSSSRDGNQEVYAMDGGGANLTRLTDNGAEDWTASWSPDGAKIAFNSNRDGNREIYVMNADGTNLTRLTYNSAVDYFPAWSPDGTKMAFESEREGNAEIYVMNADGTNQINLTNNPAYDIAPSWSPEGAKIAFYSERDGNLEIYVMNADGTNQTRLTNSPADDYGPSWSPDGTKIAFNSGRDGNQEIYVMNADGTNQTRLTRNSTGDFWPSWSPDGTRIVFYSQRDGNDEIYVMVADGSGQTRLTRNATSDHLPVWVQPRLIGAASVGSSVSHAMAIENKGNAALSVSDIVSDDGQFAVSPTRFSVAPGRSQEVTVTFTPTWVGTQYATLTISSNDLDAPAIRLMVNGTGQQPSDWPPLDVDPARAERIVFQETYDNLTLGSIVPGWVATEGGNTPRVQRTSFNSGPYGASLSNDFAVYRPFGLSLTGVVVVEIWMDPKVGSDTNNMFWLVLGSNRETSLGGIGKNDSDRWLYSTPEGQVFFEPLDGEGHKLRMEYNTETTLYNLYFDRNRDGDFDSQDFSVRGVPTGVRAGLPVTGIYINSGRGGRGTTSFFDDLVVKVIEETPLPGAMQFGETLGGIIATGEEVDGYSFEIADGPWLAIIEMGGFDTYLELWDETGALLASNDDGGASPWNSRISRMLPNGTYTILAKGYSQQTGAYQLRLTGGPVFSIGHGETKQGIISNPEESHYYSFALSSSQTVVVEMGGFDTYLELWNEAGTLLASNDDGGTSPWNSRIEQQLGSGNYVITARGYGNQTGAYQLRLSGGLRVDSVTITLSFPVGSGRLSGALSGPVEYHWMTRKPDGSFADSGPLTTTMANGAASIPRYTSFLTDQVGIDSVFVRVTSPLPVVESNKIAYEVRGIAYEETKRGTISVARAKHIYGFSVTDGPRNVVIEMGGFDTYLELLSSSGTRIAANDNGGSSPWNSRIEQQLANGSYTILAGGSGSNRGSYQLRLSSSSSMDVNGDGRVNVADAIFILEIVAGQRSSSNRADVDGNGRVNAQDALLVLRSLPSGKLLAAEPGVPIELWVPRVRMRDSGLGEGIAEWNSIAGIALGQLTFSYDPEVIADLQLSSDSERLLVFPRQAEDTVPGRMVADVFMIPTAMETPARIRFAFKNKEIYRPAFFQVDHAVFFDQRLQAYSQGQELAIEIRPVPSRFALHANYPNPFNPQTMIRFALPQEAVVRLAVYDMLGQRVRVLVEEVKPAGIYEVWWDGRDDAGAPVASGVYGYQLEAGAFSVVRKMVLVR